MKKVKHSMLLAVSCCLFSLSAEAVANAQNYTLEQVVVFSRHGLRAPLASPDSTLGKVTPNKWPQWDTTPSYLTQRGGTLESYFGHYFQEWLVDNKLLTDNTCPTEKDVYIYTNSLQRTISTGQYFAVGAFPGCIVPVEHKEKFGTMDPTFSLTLHDIDEEFKKAAIDSMTASAGKGGLAGLNQRLAAAYKNMADIIDYSESANCIKDKLCNFVSPDATFVVESGKEPGVTGSLRTGTSIADAFILQYYEGAPLNDIAWGGIKNEKQFSELVEIKERFNQVLFGAPVVAKKVAANLIRYIDDTLINHKEKAKFTFLVGHDSNVASMLAAMNVKPYHLPNQFETTPIGGKLVFSRWKDATNNEWIKLEYVYQSTEQIRQLTELNRQNPPQRVVLELENCPTNQDGFCALTDFNDAMKKALN